jgi:hypothetical protein
MDQLTKLDLPKLLSIGIAGLRGCTKLVDVTFPMLKTIAGGGL